MRWQFALPTPKEYRDCRYKHTFLGTATVQIRRWASSVGAGIRRRLGLRIRLNTRWHTMCTSQPSMHASPPSLHTTPPSMPYDTQSMHTFSPSMNTPPSPSMHTIAHGNIHDKLINPCTSQCAQLPEVPWGRACPETVRYRTYKVQLAKAWCRQHTNDGGTQHAQTGRECHAHDSGQRALGDVQHAPTMGIRRNTRTGGDRKQRAGGRK